MKRLLVALIVAALLVGATLPALASNSGSIIPVHGR